jgi:hypothetical protein
MRRSALLVAVVALFVSLVPLASAAAAPGNAAPTITALSTHPDKVTGGDVLIEVTTPDAAAARHLRLEAGGRDVTASLRQVAPMRFQALVTGLPEGTTTLVARANGQGRGTPPGRSGSLEIVNHPLSGPVYSGPQQQPWYCANAAAGLAPAEDAACTAPMQVQYRYRTTGGGFAVLADPTELPANVAEVTVGDRTIPYVVRLERGVINRGLYEVAALYDGEAPSPFRSEAGRNGALVMTFGGGCNVGYHMGSATGGVVNHDLLSRGYTVASSSLLVNDTNCNPVTASETALMVKERVIESYGPVRHTIGWGGSGGAIMQYTIAHAYPGILDGLLPQMSYADSFSNPGAPDCQLLTRYLSTSPGSSLTTAQRQAIGGHRNFNSCTAWVMSFANRIDATTGCHSSVPTSTRYVPDVRPDGVRCSLADHVVNLLGEAEDGYARTAFHNDGVQYGLAALNSGTITVDQFLDLNAGMGGFDRDGLRQATRSVGDPVGIERTYSTGLVTSGHGGLDSVPMIDLRVYLDAAADIHTSFWSVAMHERLVRDGVDPRLHSRWIYGSGGNRPAQALDAMEEWLTEISADTAPGTAAERAVRNKPASAGDGCWPTSTGAKVEDLQACYSGPFPYSGDPRTVAGAPITNDVIRCQQAAPEPADYQVDFTPAQRDRLQAVFPNGICDYSAPGVGQVPLAGTWQLYR